MAQLDVSDILLDADFADFDLVCERNSQTVGDNGRAALTTDEIPFSAVVTNDSGDILQRAGDGERIAGNITVHTQLRLIGGDQGMTADIIRWNDRRYTVAKVSDWSRFGSGFCAASCDLIPLSG